MFKNINKETFKTVVITFLITANVAFLLGIKYQQIQTQNMQNEVQRQVQTLKAEETPVKPAQ